MQVFRWTEVKAGSLWCELVFGDAREVTHPGDLSDAPRELLEAMTDLVCGAERAMWSLQLEPVVDEWTFERSGDTVTMISRAYLNGRPMPDSTRSVTDIPLLALAQSVLDSTEDMVRGGLGVSCEKEWSEPSEYPVPREQLDRLAERLGRAPGGEREP